jgi:hypothetical protein
MSWSNRVFNYTRNEQSLFLDGKVNLKDVLDANPKWSLTDIIVGGGMETPHFLINRWDHYKIINKCDTDIFYSYSVIPLNRDAVVTECACGTLLQYNNALAFKQDGYYMPYDEQAIHCTGCHRIWDGNAQCTCWSSST